MVSDLRFSPCNHHTNQVTTNCHAQSTSPHSSDRWTRHHRIGLREKDDKQVSIDLGKTEIDLGKKDSYFSPYFILGGIAVVAGIAMFATARK